MLLSIQKIFLNLKISLFILGLGITLVGIQLINVTQYSQRLEALKSQHTIIEQIVNTDLKEIEMATITINGHIAELTLAVKLSTDKALLDSLLISTHEEAGLGDNLRTASSSFKDASVFWLESMPHGRETMRQQMINKRNIYLLQIDHMIDYQIQLINESISMTKKTGIALFILWFIFFVLYRYRLNQIYADINKACSVDTDGTKPDVKMQEIDFIVKRLARKAPLVNTSQSLLHPQSGLNNEKGMLTLYNSKRTLKSSNSLFIAIFEIDQHSNLATSMSKDDMGSIYKKIGEIITMYEQPMDIIAQLDNQSFLFVMSRNSKDIALSDAEKIIHSIHDSSFSTSKGSIKVTMSGGLLLKTPASSLEASIADAQKVAVKAKESGGNRVAQLREKADQYR
jgi:GGDEF domain-containing protein